MLFKINRPAWLKVTNASTLPSLVRQLGVAEPEVASVAAKLARENHLSAEAVVAPGQQLTLSNDFFSSGGSARPLRGLADETPIGSLGTRLETLGWSTERPSVTNNLGSLGALSLIDIVTRAIDRGELSVSAPLMPGPHAIPIGDKRVLIDVPAGTTVRVSAVVKPGTKGLELGSADVSFSRSVALKNPADLSFAAHSQLGELANGLVQVTLDGVGVTADGSVTPRGSLVRPSLNPLKHVFSTGKRTHSLEGLVTFTGKPRVRTSLEALARGDLLSERPPLADAQMPLHFEVDALLKSLGALVEKGAFTLRLEGRSGFVEVGDRQMKVVGANKQLSATLTGDFEVRDGALAVQTQGTITHPLSASVKFSEAGAPGAEVGPMRVASVDGAMQVFAGGALVGSVRAAADRFHFAVPEAVHFTFDGDAMVHGSTLIRPTASGVMIEEGAVKLTIDLAGAKARTDSLEVELGKGSAVTLSATGLSTVGDDLRVEHASAGFSVTATGLAKKGPLTFKLEEGGASGQLKVTGDGAQGDIRYGLSFRPKVGPVALPAHASLEGEAQVTLLQDAVWVQSANGVRLGL